MDEQHARELLARERARVEADLADLVPPGGEDDHDPVGPGDGGADLQEAELEEGLRDRLHSDLDSIERAERRLAEGTYGHSVQSGDPIPDARLEAIPWAELTAEEQVRGG
jgi:DnaK suppressor protein